MTKTRFLALITALALLLTIPTAAFAQSARPHNFAGTVTLDDAAAADNTAVTAWVDGVVVASTLVSDGKYFLQVGSEVGFDGKTVQFKVGAAVADLKDPVSWEEGGGDELNLTASSSGATTSPPVVGAGKDGKDGLDGKDGDDGLDGKDGDDGDDGRVGDTGAAGSTGLSGADGDDGGGGVIGIIALIIAILAVMGAGGAYMMGRRA